MSTSLPEIARASARRGRAGSGPPGRLLGCPSAGPARSSQPGLALSPPLSGLTFVNEVGTLSPGSAVIMMVFSTWSRYCQDIAPVLARQMHSYPDVYFCAVSLETPATLRIYLHTFPGLSSLNVASDTGRTVRTFLAARGIASVPHVFAFTPSGVLFWNGHLLSPNFEASLVRIAGPPKVDSRASERAFVATALQFDGTKPRGLPPSPPARSRAAPAPSSEQIGSPGGLGTPGFSFWSLASGGPSWASAASPRRSGRAGCAESIGPSSQSAPSVQQGDADVEDLYGIDSSLKYMRALSPNLENPSRERQLRASRRAFSPPPRMVRNAAFLAEVNRRLDGLDETSRSSLSPAFCNGATLQSLRDMTDPTLSQQPTSVVSPAPERVSTIPELSYVALSLAGESREIPGVKHPQRASPSPTLRAGVIDSYTIYDPCGRKSLSPVAVRSYSPTHSFLPDDPSARAGRTDGDIRLMLRKTRKLARLEIPEADLFP